MSNIADPALSKPRSCKQPPPESTLFIRELHAGKIAEEASEYNWSDLNLIEASKPNNKEIQQLQQLYYDSLGATVEYICQRDALISSLLPPLRAASLILLFSSIYMTKRQGISGRTKATQNPRTTATQNLSRQDDTLLGLESNRWKHLQQLTF